MNINIVWVDQFEALFSHWFHVRRRFYSSALDYNENHDFHAFHKYAWEYFTKTFIKCKAPWNRFCRNHENACPLSLNCSLWDTSRREETVNSSMEIHFFIIIHHYSNRTCGLVAITSASHAEDRTWARPGPLQDEPAQEPCEALCTQDGMMVPNSPESTWMHEF